MVKPFLVGSNSAGGFLHLGAEVLKRGGSALDAVEVTIRAVESNPDDHGVGLGGIPNLLGQVQLDASFMDGGTRAAGCVAAVEGYLHVISIARKVMEVSPHVLLVGPGAELFAERMGFRREELLTDYCKKFYKAFLGDSLDKLEPEFAKDIGYLEEDYLNYRPKEWYERLAEKAQGTVNVLAMDARSDICSGVSTSGTYLKFPGRVGDSPIIGAGNYCDNRYGAAACTGRGELSIRHSTARVIITYMSLGYTAKEACNKAMSEVHGMAEEPVLSCVAFDNRGNVAAASTSGEPLYFYMDIDMDSEEMRRGVWVRE
jgi:beta-aspartyl-peptidase (threonine type)